MNNLRDLRNQYRNVAIAPETLFLLNSDQAITFIREALAKDAKFVGIEGFTITAEGAYQPRQEFSNDIVDWKDKYEGFIFQTYEIIKRGAKEAIFFQVVFENE